MKQIIFIILCVLSLPVFLWAQTPPMIEKHIFLPEKPSEKSETIASDSLAQKLLFTGVIISGKGKWAIIKEKAPKKRQDQAGSGVYKEGDEILGATIAKIASNHLVLRNEGDDINLKLFSGDKKRPAPVKATNPGAGKSPAAKKKQPKKANPTGNASAKKKKNPEAARDPKKTLDNQIRQREAKKGNVLSPSANPFSQALKKAMENKKNTSSTGATNPFIEAIKRAQQKK